jgi:hypothetical protein
VTSSGTSDAPAVTKGGNASTYPKRRENIFRGFYSLVAAALYLRGGISSPRESLRQAKK